MSDEESLEEEMQLKFKVMKGDPFTLTVKASATVPELKRMVEELYAHPVDQQRIIFCGKVLKNEKCLNDYPGIKSGITLHLVVQQPRGGGIRANASSTSTAASSSNTSPPRLPTTRADGAPNANGNAGRRIFSGSFPQFISSRGEMEGDVFNVQFGGPVMMVRWCAGKAGWKDQQ